jgi:hypothetical protein
MQPTTSANEVCFFCSVTTFVSVSQPQISFFPLFQQEGTVTSIKQSRGKLQDLSNFRLT